MGKVCYVLLSYMNVVKKAMLLKLKSNLDSSVIQSCSRLAFTAFAISAAFQSLSLYSTETTTTMAAAAVTSHAVHILACD